MIPVSEIHYTPVFEEIKGTVASVRLDSLLALAFSSSRTRLTGLIEGAKVYVNGRLITSNGYQPAEGDVVSVRGMGKFRFDSIGEMCIRDSEKTAYNKALYQGELFAQDLCVASEEVLPEGYQPDSTLHAAGLFDLGQEQVVCGYKIFDRLYPASTTKTMTAYLALKYGNPDDIITVSENATDFNWDESIAGLETGDTLTLYDLKMCIRDRCYNAVTQTEKPACS